MPVLRGLGVVTKADGLAVMALCSAIRQFQLSENAISKYGIMIAEFDEETGAATLKKNPAVATKSDALRQLNSSMAKFGLDPVSRSRLQLGDPGNKAGDVLGSILRGSNRDEIIY